VGVALPGIKIGWESAGGGCRISKVGGVLRVRGTLERIDPSCDTHERSTGFAYDDARVLNRRNDYGER